MNTDTVIHLIPNAHLDPVWLWDWREGCTEMIATTRTVLDLMDEFPDLTFVRGEAFVYRHIEESDPPTFKRLLAQVRAGRWDVVGGNVVQSDMNLPATESCLRHLLYAQRYFEEHLGVRARVGWSADCFGHSVALPDLLAAGGIEAYSYTRPKSVPPDSTFWWEGPAGSRLLVHHPTVGNYITERHEMPSRLDKVQGKAEEGPCRNVACFMGLGNHGGHPTRRMLAEARDWAQAHPQVDVVFSTLTRFFAALRAEAGELPESAVPVFRGEVNFAPRGIYAAGARFKFFYRKAEAALGRAERIASVAAASQEAPSHSAGDLREAWEAVLFNTFHDILPGASIERVYDEQADWLAHAPHAARKAEQRAVQSLTRRIDARVRPPAPDMPSGVPMLVFNPHPWPYAGPVELEACLDYRPLWKYRNRPDEAPVVVLDSEAKALPLQKIAPESLYAPALNIRNRVVVPVEVPPMGWTVLEFAHVEDAPVVPVPEPVTAGDHSIANGLWEVSAAPGEAGIQLRRGGASLLEAAGMSAVTVEDPWGIWGDFDDSPESLSLTQVRETWRVTRVEVTERGPLRATLNVRFEAGRSRLDLALSLSRDRDALDVRARVFWDERCARLKLVLPGRFTQAEYDVMGGSIRRGSMGEVPGGRWVRLEGSGASLGFASDALYGFNLTSEGALQASVVRATRHTADAPAQREEHPWLAVQGIGELRFSFLLTADLDALQRLAAELEQPLLVAHAVPSSGDWARSGSLMALAPESVRLLALKPAEDGDGWVLRLQSGADAVVTPRLTWMGRVLPLPPLAPRALATFRIIPSAGDAWKAVATDLVEHSS
jgi:alpha-mannosidase